MSVKWTIVKGFVLFVILVITSSLISQFFQVPFGEVNYFLRHGWFFLIFITFFPRLTLLFSSVPFGGVLWWFGLVFCPRVLVATLATVTYFKTNPVLVVISWMVALSGEIFEKWGLGKNKVIFKRYHRPAYQTQSNTENRSMNNGDTIEAEYTVKDEE
ncbi:MAG: hypothetical protein ACOYL6_06445 [Bacteriovoracaceae bacterium]